MKVSGTWLGEYTYGDGYEDIAGKSVPFTMSLTESWLGRVLGYVRDDATQGGQPERGKIRGSRRRLTLEFVKSMPTGYVFDPDGKLEPRSSWLKRAFGIDEDPDEPHRIHYIGRLSADGGSVRGEWVIRRGQLDTEQGVIEFGGAGTWSARRTSDLPSEV